MTPSWRFFQSYRLSTTVLCSSKQRYVRRVCYPRESCRRVVGVLLQQQVPGVGEAALEDEALAGVSHDKTYLVAVLRGVAVLWAFLARRFRVQGATTSLHESVGQQHPAVTTKRERLAGDG